MTASTPESEPSRARTTGMPPPPEQMTMTPSATRSTIASRGTISMGSGEGTTRRQPRPASSFMAKPFSSIMVFARASS